MPGLLRSLLGLIILIATIGLVTCQSMRKTQASDAYNAAEGSSLLRMQAK